MVVLLKLMWGRSTRLTATVGSGATAVSQQGLELSTPLMLKLAVCVSVVNHWTEM